MNITIIQPALKWVVAEQFQEYLLWKPFIVKTDNNPLTYIMTTPNLDATQHCWVKSLVGFTFSTKYQKGWVSAAADTLRQVTSKLDVETVKSILNGVTMGTTGRVHAHDPVVAEADEEIHKQVQKTVVQATATHIHVNLHGTDWVATQQEDLILKTVIEWISNWKVQDLKHLLGDDTNMEEGKAILWEWKILMLYQEALYYCHTLAGKLEEVMWFVVPTVHRVAAMNGCHQDAGHQGQLQTLYLLQDQLWWSSIATQMQKVISNCKWCVQDEGTHVKVPMQPIIAAAPLELLHIDFTSIEMTMELDQPPNVVSILVFCKYFMKHIMANVTPNQTAKTVARFLLQGYTSIFRALVKLLSDWGANFESNIIKELCALMGIWNIWTSPYHAQSNRQVEWAHQMLMHMMGKLSKDQKAE